MQATKFLSLSGNYQSADGARYRVMCGAHVALPPNNASVVTETASLAAYLAAEGLSLALVAGGPVPALTARQLRLWIINDGMTLDAVETAIGAITDATERARARVEWEYASAYHHDHPLVLQIGAALGLTPEQIDAAFRTAARL